MAKTVKTPRISVNKLAEYLEANVTRRKQIIYDAKYPAAYKSTRYKEAGETIILFLIGSKGEDYVLSIIEDLEKKTPRSDFQDNDNKLSAELLESFLDSDISLLDGCKINICDHDNVLVDINGVNISINPDLIVVKKINKTTQIGAIKLYLPKTELSEEGQKIVATMIYIYVDKNLIQKDEVANLKLCLSFNVFNKHFECAPTAYKLRMRQIEIACEEIALRWDAI